MQTGFDMKAALKTPLRFLLEGELVKDDKGLRVKTPVGEVSYVRLMGRVTDLFINREGTYGSLTLDDETGVMQARFFREDVAKLKDVKLGDLVDLVGRVRVYRERRHVVADGFSVLGDINWALLRKLEVMESARKDVKGEILDYIREEGEVLMVEVSEKWGEDSKKVLDLKNEGEIYEPKPGTLKAVE